MLENRHVTADFADSAQRGHPQATRGQWAGRLQVGVHLWSRSAGDIDTGTEAARISAASASTCSGVAGTCGSRGSPTSMPCRRRPVFAIVTPPSRFIAAYSGVNETLILRAVAISPDPNADNSSLSCPGARCEITLMNPVAPIANHGRLSGSSPE